MRQFLTFNTINIESDKIRVCTNEWGDYENLAIISLRDFAKIAQIHFFIVDSSMVEDLKLRMLIELWFPIDDRISGYLTGDLIENND